MLYDIQSIQVNGRKRPINEDKVRALAASIAENGLLQPIGINASSVLIFGLHRLEAHKYLGLSQIEAKVFDIDPLDAELAEIDENLQRNDLTVLEQGEHLLRRNQILEEKGQRRNVGGNGSNQHVSNGETVSPLLKTTPEIATEIGLSERSAQQRTQIARNLLPEVREVIRDLPIADSTTQLLALARLEPSQQMQAATKIVSAAEHEEKQAAVRSQRMGATVYSSESNEWYTPAHIAELASRVMGGIDLDPASSPIANMIVQAEAYYTIEDDGYTQSWGDKENPLNIWLNPPYGKEEGESQSNTIRWSRKLIAERKKGHIRAAILLVKAALGYNWFEELWYAYPTCFLRERLSFIRPNGKNDGQSKQGTALIYFGDDVDAFRKVFRPLGRVILPDSEEL